MSEETTFSIEITDPKGIEDLSEDSVRKLVAALKVLPNLKEFKGFVRSTKGVAVKFNFGPDGNFAGVTAKVNGKDVTLIPGVNSNQLTIFYGPPTSTNPGVGWEIEEELTVSVLKQTEGDQNSWELFFAKPVSIFNNFTN